MLTKDYTEKTIGGLPCIQLTSGPYQGIDYTYGKVQLVEKEDRLRLKFDLQVLNDVDCLAEDHDFIQYVGEILETMIREGLMKNDLVFSGGINESN
jgi:hypothetical protein